MTEKQLRRRVEFWQERLALLGVSHFRIDECSIVEEPDGDYGAQASVWTSDKYDRFKMQFAREHVEEADEQGLDETIIHELVHVAMRDYDHAVEYIGGYELGQPAFQAWSRRVLHEREGIVDRFAKLIYALHAENC